MCAPQRALTADEATGADLFLKIVEAWDDPSVSCRPQPGLLPWMYQLAPACDPLFNALGCGYSDRHEAAAARL